MKKICVFVMFFLLVTLIQAKKPATLAELMRPDMVSIDDDLICVTEKFSVYIYSLEDFHLIKKFGKEGEGPQEFKIFPIGPPMIAVPYNQKIYVSSFAKLSVFTKEGKFIEESKIRPFSLFRPFGNRYLATGTTANEKNKTVLAVNLHNEKFEKVKELYVSDIDASTAFVMSFPMTGFSFTPYKDRIYVVAGKEGFVIDVFDDKGNKLYRIKKDYKPLPVPEEYKKKTIDWFKKDPVYKRFYEYMKQRISFKTHFPAVRYMMASDERIFVLTYKTKGKKTECIVMDLQGNEKKRVFLDCPENLGMDYHPKFEFYKGKFYTLVENIDEEAWELHAVQIE